MRVCGGLSTIEEKSMGAYAKCGSSQISGIIKPGDEILELIKDVARGETPKSEHRGHREFILTYKRFEPIGPACLRQRQTCEVKCVRPHKRRQSWTALIT